MVQDGPWGIQQLLNEPVDEEVDDPATYSIDWEVADDFMLMNHLLQENPQEWEDNNPFSLVLTSGLLSHVECEPPSSPFSPIDLHSRSMNIQRLVWMEALEICR